MDTDTLLATCAVTEDQLEDAGVQATTLLEIHDDYLKCRNDLADHGAFLVQQLQHFNEAHSLKYRVKDPIHLIRKIVRKSKERPNARIDAANYSSEITDLVGVRVLHLYKDDWRPIHDFIRKMWSLKDGEEPIAYIRHGDETDSALSGCCTVKTHPREYRSLHYVIEYAYPCSSRSSGLGDGTTPDRFGGRERWSRIRQSSALERSTVHLGVVASEAAVEQRAGPDEALATLRVPWLAGTISDALRRLARTRRRVSVCPGGASVPENGRPTGCRAGAHGLPLPQGRAMVTLAP
jgi:ppGpp synthetase/RelA/SpoT-type nucleotidyltranferase